MFKITIVDVESLKKQVSVISNLLTDVLIKVDKEKLSFSAMDPANVVYVHYELFSSACAEYNCPEEEDFGINMSDFKEIIKTASNDSIITLSKERERLNILIKGLTKRNFKLPLIDDATDCKEINLSSGSELMIDSEVLKQEIESSAVVGESVVFETMGDTLKLNIEDDTRKEYSSVIDNPDIITINGQDQKGKYSLEYLKKIVKSSSVCDKAIIFFKTDNPLSIIYKLPDKSKMQFILAPRVEND